MTETLTASDDLELRTDEILSKYTAARLGGEADLFAIAKSTNALQRAVMWAHENGVRWVILGGGTNVLVSDKGFRGLVIINHAKQVNINSDTGMVEAESGTNLSTLARRCMAKGLKGMEWCVSVPGTLGGAIVNNAGAHGADMSDNLSELQILDLATPDHTQYWFVDKLEYDYRHSILKGVRDRYIVLKGILKLEAGHDPAELKAIADTFVTHRKRTQPPGASLGSIFKNPYGDYAGRLIDVSGLKGHQIGGVQVSELHGNFFISGDEGTASDYSSLIDYIQETVADETGTNLEIEIERIGQGFDD